MMNIVLLATVLEQVTAEVDAALSSALECDDAQALEAACEFAETYGLEQTTMKFFHAMERFHVRSGSISITGATGFYGTSVNGTYVNRGMLQNGRDSFQCRGDHRHVLWCAQNGTWYVSNSNQSNPRFGPDSQTGIAMGIADGYARSVGTNFTDPCDVEQWRVRESPTQWQDQDLVVRYFTVAASKDERAASQETQDSDGSHDEADDDWLGGVSVVGVSGRAPRNGKKKMNKKKGGMKDKKRK